MTWLQKCREWVRKYDPVTQEHLESPTLHHYAFVRRLSERLPDNAIITYDTGGNAIMMGHCFRSKEGQRIFSSNGNTPMGFAMCAAIGAWFAQPERPIICIIGDGGFQLNSQELQTIKHYKVPVKVFILNNKILGNTKSYQRVNGKAELACGPDGYSAPDFDKVVEAYDILCLRCVDHFYGYSWTIDAMLGRRDAVVMDVVHDDFCIYEPRMSRWDASINEMHPPLAEEEFLANCINPPLEGWEKRRGD